jgi:threonine aldolase
VLYALDNNVERLAEDHARAARLARGLAERGLPVDPDTVETNFIGLDVASLGVSVREAQELVEREGVLVGGLRPGVVRIATYLGITDDDIDTAIDAIPGALAHLIGNGTGDARASSVGTAIPRDR